MVPRIGFIGLGIMGMPMARNLMKAGFPLTVHNRSQAKVEDLVKEGARRAASPREVASATDIVITMLPNSPDVELVALGASGIRQGVRAGQLFIDMSTINPIVSQKIGKELAPLGVAMVDAPVSGGEKGAIDGALSIMAGGAPEDFERALPVFNALGKTITHMGPIGAGGFTKLANQIIVAVNLTAIGEALVFGAKAGVDPQKMIRALAGGLAGSKCLDQKSEKILSGDFAPGFKIDLHFKDLNLIQDAARSVGVPIPTAAFVEQLFAALRVRGRGGLDHSGVITLFEDLAGVQVRRTQSSA
ncbi:MAG: 2-hydroxy-3-oxopropionate reductase [Acidobacteria bacterium]|nr:MAG: 2-hydroxy-3-oxopropionate reductase [Acidobacteriota bacterium]PYS12415.1 MAG: 2-hydroxy-3-oxopropionate reductase [Acidobacteriota bacterium]